MRTNAPLRPILTRGAHTHTHPDIKSPDWGDTSPRAQIRLVISFSFPRCADTVWGGLCSVRVLVVPMIAKRLFLQMFEAQKNEEKEKKKLSRRCPAAGYTIYSCRGGRKLFAESRREFVMMVMNVAESRPRSNEGCEAKCWCKRKSRQPALSIDLPLIK